MSIEFEAAAIKNQQTVEAALIERPVSHRPSVYVDKAGMRIPADAAALHRPGFAHCVG